MRPLPVIHRLCRAGLPAVIVLLVSLSVGGQEKKAAAGGNVTEGVVTAKGDAWIEVQADGDKPPRRYVPKWQGASPIEGGGNPDPAAVAQIKGVPVGARVRVQWELIDDRPRIVKIEVLKAETPERPPGSEKKPEPKPEKKPDTGKKPEPEKKPEPDKTAVPPPAGGPVVAPPPRPKGP